MSKGSRAIIPLIPWRIHLAGEGLGTVTVPIIFALALSLDGLFAGLAYGLREIHIPLRSMLTVATCTLVGMSGSMLLGNFASGLISERTTQLIGATVLGGIGLWQLFQGWLEYMRRNTGELHNAIFRFQVKDLGFVVQVLREPTLADADRSGIIDTKEALLLGAALGMDSFGAGFAAALLGFGGLMLIPLVTLSQPMLTWIGLQLGRRFGPRLARGKGLLLPGVILCLLALLQL